jgi:hypothetical protein
MVILEEDPPKKAGVRVFIATVPPFDLRITANEIASAGAGILF